MPKCFKDILMFEQNNPDKEMPEPCNGNGYCNMESKNKSGCDCYDPNNKDSECKIDNSACVTAGSTVLCSGNGECVNRGSKFECKCYLPWGGSKCEKNEGHKCNIEDKPCSGNGDCGFK